MKKRNKCSLLPYIREDIHGDSPRTNQFFGWEIQKFDIASLWCRSTGEGVVVAVIDTGCDLDHVDLKDNLLPGKNIINPSKDPIDGNGHGTHVSGTIAACNNAWGMVGVAPSTKIIPVKALNDDGAGNYYDISKAIVWSADQNVNFITMSLGSPVDSPEIREAINYANKKGAIVFCAAGNSGESSPIMYPAQYENVISIGAIDENLERTSFTCSGESLDFLAPGHNIVSTIPGNKYALMSGTSMSNPFAVGCAALLLSSRKQIFSTTEYINIFKKTALPLRDSRFTGKKNYEGYGIIVPTI